MILLCIGGKEMEIRVKFKLAMIVIITFLCVGVNVTNVSAHEEEISSSVEETNVKKVIRGFTDEDVYNEFANYCDPDVIVVYDNLNEDQGRAVGCVYDYTNEKYISAATIQIQELGITAKTDSNGHFEIKNLPAGKYTWIITAENYESAVYKNYSIDSVYGIDIFTFEIDSYEKIERSYSVPSNSCIEQYNEEDNESMIQSMEYTSVNDINDTYIELAATTRDTGTPQLYYFNISYNGGLYCVDMDTYLMSVLPCELYSAAYYKSKYGLTSAQIQEAFKAQAVAARSYANYIARYNTNHKGKAYALCSTTHCQAYNPEKISYEATQAVLSTSEKILINYTNSAKTNYTYVNACFFASCKKKTTSAESRWGYAYSYLVSVSCPYDVRPTLQSGHGVGMCQDGAIGYAKNNWKYDAILKHYYTGSTIITALPQPD